MSMRNPLARRVIAALLLVLLTACHSWRPTAVGPQGWTPEERPSSVRATLTNGETLTKIHQPGRGDETDEGVLIGSFTYTPIPIP